MKLKVERIIRKPYHFAEAALLDPSADWLPGQLPARAGLSTRLALDLGGVTLTRRVVVQTGAGAFRHRRCELPVWWEDEEHPRRYPVLSGVLELRRLAPRRARLILHATYDPPAGVIGEVADRALLHLVAEASLSGFMDRVAAVLEREALSIGVAAAEQGRSASQSALGLLELGLADLPGGKATAQDLEGLLVLGAPTGEGKDGPHHQGGEAAPEQQRYQGSDQHHRPPEIAHSRVPPHHQRSSMTRSMRQG